MSSPRKRAAIWKANNESEHLKLKLRTTEVKLRLSENQLALAEQSEQSLSRKNHELLVWQNEASAALARFVDLSATPDFLAWGLVATEAIRLMNSRNDNNAVPGTT